MSPIAGKLGPQSLPSVNPFPFNTPTRTAYDACLALEQREGWDTLDADLQNADEEHAMFMYQSSPLVAARVLGHALVLAPSEDGRQALAREINDCDGDVELLAGLAYLYVSELVRVFYNENALISPEQSPHFLGLLLRDNFRCVFTGAGDSEAKHPLPGIPLDIINITHIISQSLSTDISGTTERVRERFEWARTAGAMIDRFGGFSHDVLGDKVLNSPLNAFITSPAARSAFDRLELWLTPAIGEHYQVIPNTYDVQHFRGSEVLYRMGSGIRSRILFRSTQVGNRTIPSPDPRIIALHAACERIAHMSGAAGWLREFFRGRDEISITTEPNAAYELCRALRQVRTQLVSATA